MEILCICHTASCEGATIKFTVTDSTISSIQSRKALTHCTSKNSLVLYQIFTTPGRKFAVQGTISHYRQSLCNALCSSQMLWLYVSGCGYAIMAQTKQMCNCQLSVCVNFLQYLPSVCVLTKI